MQIRCRNAIVRNEGKMDKIAIKSSLYDYEVEFVENFEEKLNTFGETTVYVIDKNVYNLYRKGFDSIDSEKIFLMDAVESKKNIQTVLELIYFWKKRSVRKNWKVICFGGGITQDVTTFASNIFLRNIEWYFFPTTLLAMADSCIGGKCGINLEEYKNQLGVFYPPRKIYICITFLKTLSRADYINGWGELLKFSLTERADFFKELLGEKSFIPCEQINHYIHEGLSVKKKIIEADEFEGDLRRVLNYGHTFGHALEAYTHNEIAHGTAVIWGIDVANYISYREGILCYDDYDTIKRLIRKNFILEEIVIDMPDRILEIVRTDKKVKNNTIYLALLVKISELVIYPMEMDEHLKSLFITYLEETHEYYCD